MRNGPPENDTPKDKITGFWEGTGLYMCPNHKNHHKNTPRLCCRKGDVFCRICRYYLRDRNSHCDRCGSEVLHVDIFCHRCGRKLDAPATRPRSKGG